MRRKKIDNIETVRETIESITEFLPEELEMISNMLSGARDSVANLKSMRHVDYIKARKVLLNVSKKCNEMRETILLTHKIFTQEK